MTSVGWGRAAVVALGLAISCSPAPAETPDSDPRAVQIADQVTKALGGGQRWESLRCLGWTFESTRGDTLRPGGRRHVWDKHAGLHRVEGKNRQGQSYVIIHRLDRPEGKAWVDGVALEGDSLENMLKRAKSLWTNDTYWMLMPYKLRDPGVRLKHEGEVTEGGITFDKLALSFDQVGETPGDRYWVFVNRANHRIEKWEHLLQGAEPPPRAWTWEGWEQHDGLWFPTTHRSGENTLYTRAVQTMSEPPAGAFSAP